MYQYADENDSLLENEYLAGVYDDYTDEESYDEEDINLEYEEHTHDGQLYNEYDAYINILCYESCSINILNFIELLNLAIKTEKIKVFNQ